MGIASLIVLMAMLSGCSRDEKDYDVKESNSVTAASSTRSGKMELELGWTGYAPPSLWRAVEDFNRTSTEYRVEMTELSSEEGGIGGLDKSIAEDRVPDLLLVSDDMPLESYAEKGLFEDLTDRFQEDRELQEDKLLTNVIDACRIRSRMYFVVPSFRIVALLGKKTDFGDIKGVTVGQLEDLIREKDLNYDTAFGLVGRESILNWLLFNSMDQYVDRETGSCSFMSASFTDLLKFAANFPAQIHYEKLDREKFEKAEAGIRSGIQLARDVSISGFDDYLIERYGYFGEEIACMGYPAEEESGPIIKTDQMLAMSRKSRGKEGCWEFLRSLYLGPYQTEVEDSFPVNKEALHQQAEESKKAEWDGRDTSEEPIRLVHQIGTTEVKIPVLEQQDEDEVLRILEGLTTRWGADPTICQIVQEEAGAFFAGKKSAEECAQIIQNRVSIYINETG